MKPRLIVAALVILLAGFAQAPEPYTLVISGGHVVDGAGNPWFYGDLGIRGDRIARITSPGMLHDAPAQNTIDAHGLVVAPGFIDIQSASGTPLLAGNEGAISHIAQGITTDIMGEGWTPAPANDKTLASMQSLGRVASAVRFGGTHGFDTWLRAIAEKGALANFGSFVGAATVRQYVKGMEQGEATPAEIGEMQTLVRDAMRDGAFGIGSALIYPPGNYAGTHELAEMCKAAAPLGGIYITHMRSEADHLIEAVDETLAIGREGGVPVEIYHLKAGGRRNWPKMQQAIARIDAARKAGQDAGADMYPYTAGATGLTACFPPRSAADGKLFDNLKDPAVRARMKEEMIATNVDWENLGLQAGPENVLIVALDQPENKQYAGKRLAEIARMRKQDWRDAAMDLVLSEHKRVETIYFMMSDDNVRLGLKQSWIKIGTDSSAVDPVRANGLAHPRSYGTFPRILGQYVRDEHLLPLEDAVRKMTSATAARLSIRDRGLLRPGMFADIVIFAADKIADRATYEQPHQLPEGIRYVIVNGQVVMRDNQLTGVRPGRALRGPGYTPAH
jgi:dihydroorotase/N-acyl-D-amino-acid deacylase